MSKKWGLALGSGGARGVCHAGVIKALEESGLRPDYICGCSMGAVVGACYANGMSADEMLAAVEKITAVKLIDLTAAPIKKMALMRGAKMQKLLYAHLKNADFKNLQIAFSCLATDLICGRAVVLDGGNVVKAVRASAAIPAVFAPVKCGQMLLVDGGVACRVPVEQVKKMGAECVVAVDALINTGERVDKIDNVFSVLTRSFDVMDSSRQALIKNSASTDRVIWIEPEIEGVSQYHIKNFKRAFDGGYMAAKSKIRQIKKLIL